MVVGAPRRLWTWWWSKPGRLPRIFVTVACLSIVGMYCTNDDMNKEPDAVRGDGKYHPVLARGDGHMLYLMARSTAVDLDWVFDNDLARFGDPWRQAKTPTGRKGIAHPIGPPLVWTPMIWVASAGAVVANLFGADIPLHGYTLWHQRFVFLSSALFGCGAVLLGLWLARKLVGGAWSPPYAAIAVLLGTPITYYATYMPSYAHAMDAFACAGFLAYWAITVGRRDLKRFVVLGALLGLAMLVRVQELALGIVVAVEIAVALVRDRKSPPDIGRWILGGVIVLAASIVVFTPQLLEWQVVYGKATSLPHGAKYTRLEAPMIPELLFSSRNGWFSTTPIAYFAVIGLVLVPKRSRLVAGGLLAAVAIQVYLNSTILDWWGSAGFGQRRMCNVTLPLVVGLAAVIWRMGRLAARVRRVPRWVWHVAIVLALGPFVAFNVRKAFQLRGGKSAPSDVGPSCCNNFPDEIRGPARWWFDQIGNPFQYPANLVFAIRHDVDLHRWDQVGNYPLVPPLHTLLDDQLWRQRGAWKIGNRGIEPWLVSGLSNAQQAPLDRGGRWYRFTVAPSATVLVPNLMPYGQRMTLWLGPYGAQRAKVRWNGEVVADVELTAWTPVRFDLPEIELHTNELTVEGIGIAVGDLELEFLGPE